MGGRSAGFNAAQALVVPVQHRPLGFQPGAALHQFHVAGVGGHAGAVIQPGGVGTHLDGGVRVHIKGHRRGGQHQRGSQQRRRIKTELT